MSCLLDSEGDPGFGFEALVDGHQYSLEPAQQQRLVERHRNVRSGVFVLYSGDNKDAEPIGTSFSINDKLALMMEVVQKKQN